MSLVDEPAESSSSGDPEVDLRLLEVERTLVDLRRLVSRDRPAFPNEPFHAFELRIEGRTFLLPAHPVREVLAVVVSTPVPDAPSWVRGSFRYGPLLLPMVDLGHRLFDRPTPAARELSVLVLQRPKWTGLLAPLPSGVVVVDPSELVPSDSGIPRSSAVLGALPRDSGGPAYLLSTERLGRDYILGAS